MQVNVISKKFAFLEIGDYIFLYYTGRCIGFTDGNEYYIIAPSLKLLVVHRTVKNFFPLAKFIELPLEELEKVALQKVKEALMV